jgi:type IV fimbrial biogenesis protein FimT
MQALAKGKTLTLTPLPNTNDWSKGMLLFVDNSKHQYTYNTEPLYEWHWKSADTDVSWHGFQSKDYLLFTTDLRSSINNGYFLIKNTQEQIKLIVNRVGRVRIGS